MFENKFILIGVGLLFLLLVGLLIKFIYWKSLRLEHVAELKTSVGLKDYKTMRGLVGVPGVWAQYVGRHCYNVCKTNNMGQEMMLDSRRIITGLSNTLKNDQRLRDEYERQGSVAIRYRDIVKMAALRRKKIKFVIILTIDKPDDPYLEFEEMKYAIKHKAIAWNPAPGPQTRAYAAWRENGGKIEKYKKILYED